MANKMLNDSDGNVSSKRWFAAACFVSAVGLAVGGLFADGGIDVEIIRAFLWPATIVLVGGTAAEQIKGLNVGAPR